MRCIAKAAISLDGYLDDTDAQRRVFSGPEDIVAVDQLRASVDAILIGAGTLREDNPKMRLRSPELIAQRVAKGLSEHPLRIVLSRSGELPLEFAFFQESTPKPIVFCPEDVVAEARKNIGEKAEVISLSLAKAIVCQVIEILEQRDISSLLVEGGSEILSLFLKSGALQSLRLAIAPIVLGEKGRAPIYPALAASKLDFSQSEFKKLDSLIVLECTLV